MKMKNNLNFKAMRLLSEPSTVRVLENNLVRCLRRLKGKDPMPNASDVKYREKLFKALAVFYKSINNRFEGNKKVMGKANAELKKA